MDGEQLYQMYQEEFLKLNTGTDDFDQLEPNDQAVWNALAERLEDKGQFADSQI